MAHAKRKCKTRIEIVGAGEPRPQSVRVGGPNPYEDSVAVARLLNMNQTKMSTRPSYLMDKHTTCRYSDQSATLHVHLAKS